MKKYHSLSAFFLALALSVSLCLPVHATGTEPVLLVEDMVIDAEAVLLLDADYDEVLYEHNADEKKYPASITKVMTGLLTIEAVDRGELTMDTPVTMGADLYTGIGAGGSSLDLREGETLSVRDLLNCVLIPSANEACNALAVAVAGSIDTFVEQMNTRAAELGMTSTHFVNTHGYHDDNHYTTARDLSRMCLEAMKHPEFREIVSSVSYTLPATDFHEERTIHDTNALVSNFRVTGYYYPYAIGIKTGSTPEAGYCLASAAEKDGRTVISILLGGAYWRGADGERAADNYFADSTELLEYGFDRFSRKDILSAIDPIATIPVTLCAEQDYVTVHPAAGLEATLHNDIDPAAFTRTVDLPETLEAPIEKGQTIGTISLSYEGKDYGTVELVAASSLERSQYLYTMKLLREFFSQLWVKIVLLVIVLVILFFVLRRLLFAPPRRRRRSRSSGSYSGSYRGRRR